MTSKIETGKTTFVAAITRDWAANNLNLLTLTFLYISNWSKVF